MSAMTGGLQHAHSSGVPGDAKAVVCVSWNSELAWTRELLLRAAGFHVTTILGKSQLTRLREITSTDLLILAHSVPQEEKLEALTTFRSNCRAPVLSLLMPHLAKLPGVDYAVEAFGPREFVAAVASAIAIEAVTWSAGCKGCGLIFPIATDPSPLVATHQEAISLRCPHCGATREYERKELLQDPNAPGKS
jgi:CheY-like chemotaxis protein